MRVVWSVKALQAIEEIYAYIAADKPEAARKIAERLLFAGDQLADHPHLGRAARSAELRELVVGNYVLIYRVGEDVVEIATVIHGARRRRG